MMFWLFVRLLQDSVLYKNVHIMRVSGYCIVFPWIITLIYGFYAAFGLGKNEDYNLPKKWYLLLIPGFISVAVMLTNEYHHAVFKIYPEEEENLYFHVNFGFLIILAFSVMLIVMRVCLIYSRTRSIAQKKHRRYCRQEITSAQAMHNRDLRQAAVQSPPDRAGAGLC